MLQSSSLCNAAFVAMILTGWDETVIIKAGREATAAVIFDVLYLGLPVCWPSESYKQA